MSVPRLENSDQVLIVEGHSDLLFYAEALDYLNIHPSVFIKAAGGRSTLVTNLETLITPGLLEAKQRIGVIVDADDSAAGISESLEKTLSQLSRQPVHRSAWTSIPSKCSIGLFVVPDGVSNGEIETLVWSAWINGAKGRASGDCVANYLTSMAAIDHRPQSPDKARIGALLSVLNDEDPRLGSGARARVFDFAAPELAPILTFLSGFLRSVSAPSPTAQQKAV